MTPYLQQRCLYAPLIKGRPSLNLGIVVVIPAYDEDFLLLSLMSLYKCKLPKSDIEVIVLVNDSEKDNKEVKTKNQHTVDQALKWTSSHQRNRMRFHILYQTDLPAKHAGVGLARKIGMDEACWRFEKIKYTKGIIACFDADSRCAPDYFLALEQHFKANPKAEACGIYFEHPLSGVDYSEPVYHAIAEYELHLRYFINAQKYTGFPFAYQTIGSSMAVRCDAYQRQGGMNKRKAGEDFYFIHKFTQIGRFSELKTTKVIPSPRPSHRVPFGTGKAISKMINTSAIYQTYSPKSFEDLKSFFGRISQFWNLDEERMNEELRTFPQSIQEFLSLIGFKEKLQEIKKHTTQLETFSNRFFQWFNAFILMKYLHFSRDNYYPNISVIKASRWLLEKMDKELILKEDSPKALLEQFRIFDRLS